MTNYEKYKELVISCVLNENICELAYEAYGDKSCAGRACTECRKFIEEWLNREYIKIDWSKVEVDTPVFIEDEDEEGTICRHFSGYRHGHVFVYANGQTSWTNDGVTQAWEPGCVKFGKNEDAIKYAK